MGVFSDVIPDVNSLFWVVSSFPFYSSFVHKRERRELEKEKKNKGKKKTCRETKLLRKAYLLQWSY